MPPIQLPLVKFDKDAGGFVCPKCKRRFAMHPEFVTHFSTAHAPDVGVLERGPQATPAPPPRSTGGGQVTCPVCQQKVLGSDYPAHGARHAGGGLTAAALNQEQAR
jgi:hypothetical protein